MANEQPSLQHRSMPTGTGTLNTVREIAAVLQRKSGGNQGQYKPTQGGNIIPLPRAHNNTQS